MKKQFFSFYSGKILQKNCLMKEQFYSFYSGKILQKKCLMKEQFYSFYSGIFTNVMFGIVRLI